MRHFASMNSCESVTFFGFIITILFIYGIYLSSRNRWKFDRTDLSNGQCLAYKVAISNYEAAKCIDGSPPVYYVRPGHGDGIQKWHLHFMGGAWCHDIESCRKRSRTRLGTSSKYDKCLDETFPMQGTYLDGNKDFNSLLYNFNTIIIKYCDGASYSGNSEHTHNGTTLFSRGMHIRTAIIRDLLKKGMHEATDVVISGCSAGALGVLLGLDDMSSLIRASNPNIKVLGLIDSGFFLDYASPLSVYKEWGKRPSTKLRSGRLNYAVTMREVAKFANISSGANAKCLQAYKGDGERTRCIFAENLMPFIETPLFAIQPKYDHWQLFNVLGDADDIPLVRSFGNNLTEKMKTALLQKNPHRHHAIFFDSCAHHCTSCSASGESVWHGSNIRSHEYMTPADAFGEWYHTHASQRFSRVFIQDKEYPCDDCCLCRARTS